MNKIGIIGTGAMGTDIAYIAAISGFEVSLYDINTESLDSASARIRERVERKIKSDKITGQKLEDIISRISLEKKLDAFNEIDLALECVTENIGIKKSVFQKLDDVCNTTAVLASNTSSISITEIASATRRPESVLGLHFLIPAHIMPLVEIIPGFLTTHETIELAKSVLKKLGKKFSVSRDFPGFMLNRMLVPMINEAVNLLYEGAGSADGIDKVMKIGLNQPMGPLALADMIGLDVVLAVAEEMFRGYGDQKYRPCPLLKQYVAAGYLGEKSGRGFYIYNK